MAERVALLDSHVGSGVPYESSMAGIYTPEATTGTVSVVGAPRITHEVPDHDVISCGVGHVFGHLPFRWGNPRGAKKLRGNNRPKEVRFIFMLRIMLVLSTVACITSPVMYWVLKGRMSDDNGDGVNKTDAYGPLAVQPILLLFLYLCKYKVDQLQKAQQLVKDVVNKQSRQEIATAIALGAEVVPVTVVEEHVGLPYSPTSPSSPGSPMSPYDNHLLDLQASEIVDLHIKLNPCIQHTEDPTRPPLESARCIIQEIATDGVQLAKYTPLYKGIPTLPEADRFRFSLLVGTVIAVTQSALLRASFTEQGSLTSHLAKACYWTSTVQFTLALGIYYSLLVLIIVSFRQQYLLVSRFTSMLVMQRAKRKKLPYFQLNTTQNLRVWYACRHFLMTHTTKYNAVSAVTEPAFVMLIVAVVLSTLTLVVRHLFQDKDTDLFSGGCLSMMATSLLFLFVLCYYGIYIGKSFAAHCDVMANIQYEATKQWNTKLEYLERAPPIARCEKTKQQVHELWRIRRYAQDMLEVCKAECPQPAVFGAPFSSMKWWLVIWLLLLNTCLYFALRKQQRTGPTPAPSNHTALFEL